ncbi:MAG TPA: AraC family transcriptional regulator [Steroidobacteraceae bacterium]|nr:AraC family transcriptional regulator [Steroidobacteraceae bacterium]
MDALSELLRVVKLSGALFYKSRCTSPWCLDAPSSTMFVPYVAPQATHVIEFHHISEGRAYVRVGEETTPLEAGDIVMMPHGDAHQMGNGKGGSSIDGQAALPALISGKLTLASFGGGGEETGLVCGYLACDKQLLKPVLAGLPRVLRVNLRVDKSGEWFENTLRHAVEQAANAAPGSAVFVAHLAEALFADVLRRYLASLPETRTGWLAAAGDAAVSRALGALHRRPARAWTLEDLSREVGVSRSVLNERFTRYLGVAPMGYLTEWRLELGAEALRTGHRSVQSIALDVGYESEAAFNRAFKRRFAMPPARYRRESRYQTHGAGIRKPGSRAATKLT